MAGDARNAELWTGADVFIADLGTPEPTDVTEEWPSGWEPAGLLDGEAGFTMAREEESESFYAWGGLLVRKSKSQHTRTIAFAALEDNDVVFRLVNPGSTREDDGSGLVTSRVVVPQIEEFAIGFEMRDGATTKRRMVKRASVEEVGEVVESESGLTVYNITVVLYPEADGTLFTELKNVATGS